MAGFLEGLFDDPEESTKQLVKIVHKYAQNVPELLPSLRDVINSGMLYEKKLKSFLGLLDRERKRQRCLSTEEGYETEYPASGGIETECLASDSISACSNRSLSEDGPVVKKRKKSEKRNDAHVGDSSTSVDHRVSGTSTEVHPPLVSSGITQAEDPELIQAEEAERTSVVVENVIISVLEDTNHICQSSMSTEAVVKSKNKRKKAAQGGDSVTPCKPMNPTAGADHPTVSYGTEYTRHVVDSPNQNGMVRTREEHTTDETMIDQNILNTVMEDSNHIESQPSTPSVSNTGHTPERLGCASTSDTDAGVTPFRVIPSVQLMEDPTRFPDLLPPATGSPVSSTNKFKTVSSEVVSSDGVPTRSLSIVDRPTSVSRDIHHQPGAGDALSLTGLGLTSCNSNESSSAGLNGSDPRGPTSSSGASEANSGPTTVGGSISVEHPEPSSNSDENEEASYRDYTMSPNSRLIRRLLEPSTVEWVIQRSCMKREKRKLFKLWLEIQKRSLPSDSHDNGNVLFKPPKQWLTHFEDWMRRRFPSPATSEALHSSPNSKPQQSVDGAAKHGTPNVVQPGPNNSQPRRSSEHLNGASQVEPHPNSPNIVPTSAFGAGSSMLLNIRDSAPPSGQQEIPHQTVNAVSREARRDYFHSMHQRGQGRGSRANRTAHQPRASRLARAPRTGKCISGSNTRQ